jgi:ectoine hydroxylase-related dioxygenase (phytanoyl-CoA dioxygenase family)
MHQDWSLVDERKARSVSIWCPLGATHSANGNLQMVLKSHLDFGRSRGVNVPSTFSESDELSLRRTRLLDLPMEEGDVLIFDHRMIHCSPPNRSGSERVSAVLALIPEEESLIHQYAAPGSDGTVLEMLALDPDHFYALNFFDYARKPEHLAGLGFQNTGHG